MQDGKVLGNSGITISTGFDLGQHNIYDLQQMGIKEKYIKILKPYLGLKKEEALKYLRENPLKISQDIAEYLELKVMNKKL